MDSGVFQKRSSHSVAEGVWGDKKHYLKNKERIIERHKKYRLKNKEKLSQNKKEYDLKNKKKLRQNEKNYRLKNKEKLTEYNKKYHLKNKEKVRKTNKKYRSENREIIRQTRKKDRLKNPEKYLRYQIRLFKKLGFPFKLNPHSYNYALQTWSVTVKKLGNGLCQVCNLKAEVSHHIIHKSKYPGLSLNINNGIPLCDGCHYECHGWN